MSILTTDENFRPVYMSEGAILNRTTQQISNASNKASGTCACSIITFVVFILGTAFTASCASYGCYTEDNIYCHGGAYNCDHTKYLSAAAIAISSLIGVIGCLIWSCNRCKT